MTEWFGGGGIDPTAFSLTDVNRRLAGLQGKPGAGASERTPGPGGVTGRVEAGLEWEGFLTRVDAADLLAAGPPEAQAMFADVPAEALPPLWCAGFRGSGATGFAGLCVSPDLAQVESKSQEAVLVLHGRLDGPPALPERLRVGDRRMLGWFPRLAAAGVPVEFAEELANAPGLAAEAGEALLDELLGGDDGGPFEAPAMIAGRGVRDPDLRAFHEAAAAFAFARPWRWFPPDSFLEVLEPRPPQGMKLFGVHRDGEDSFAVNFVKGVAQAKAISLTQSDAQLMGHLDEGIWSFDLTPVERALPVEAEEAERLGVAPVDIDGVGYLGTLALLRSDGVSRASRKRLGFVTALLHAVALQSQGRVSELTGQRVPLEVDGVPGVDGGRFVFRPREVG